MREDEAWGGGEVKEGNKSCVWYFHIEKKKNILKTGLGFLPLEIVEKQNTAFKKRLEMFKNKNKTKQIGEKKKKKSPRGFLSHQYSHSRKVLWVRLRDQ